MVEVREEACLWTLEEPSVKAKQPRSKSKVSDPVEETHCAAVNAYGQKSVTLDEVLKVVSEQGKQISELTQVIKDLAVKSAGTNSVRPRAPLKFTEDGQPICLKCQKEGHIAKKCP